MSIVEPLLLATSLFFALNIGGSGMAPSFSVAVGARILPRRWAIVLFVLFVTLGALWLGKFVAKTLGTGLVSPERFDAATALCVIGAAAGALFLANLLRIPQSTSWVTVFAIAMVGIEARDLNTDTIFRKLLPAWVALPVTSFLLTTAAVRVLYPMRPSNVRALEWLTRHERALQGLVVAASCYVAMAIGSNNVANVVGPLAAASVVDVVTGFLVVAPVCGLGALVFPAPARTMARDIVPLGLFTAAVSNLVTGSVLMFASWLGIPQSLVHVNAASVAAISLAKEGSWALMRRELLRRIGVLWVVSPLVAAALTAALLRVVK